MLFFHDESLVSGGLATVTTVESGDEDADEIREEALEEAGGDAGDDTADEVVVAGDTGEGAGDEPEPPDAQELEDTIRRVLRDELSGEIGQRLSQNLRRMIRDEVAQAMLRRD